MQRQRFEQLQMEEQFLRIVVLAREDLLGKVVEYVTFRPFEDLHQVGALMTISADLALGYLPYKL